MIRFHTRRARFAPLALLAAGLGSAVLGMSVTGTLSAYTASITNTTNTAASAGLTMRETDASGKQTACLSTDGNSTNTNVSCGSINKYGGTGVGLVPGAANTTSILVANTGSIAAKTFTLRAGACKNDGSSAGNPGNLCSKLLLTLTCQVNGTSGSGTALITKTALDSLGTGNLDIGAAAADCVPRTGAANDVLFTFTVQLDPNAGNDVQNQTVGQPLTWTFTGA